MVARTKQKKRGRETRKRKRVIFIGTEGSNKTEKQYFSDLGEDIGGKYVVRFAGGNYTDPEGIVQTVLSGIQQNELDLSEGDLAYCVFDTDTDPMKQRNIDNACRNAKRGGVEVVLSNPCFEVWLLQHFQYSTKQFGSNTEVIAELRKYIKSYEKNKAVFSAVKEKVQTAIQNAKKLEKYHDEQGRKADHISRNPSSAVYKIVEKIIV